jgi:hypothetical protein
VSPAGSAGNSLGELWVNNSTTINGLNYFTGSAFVNLTPSGTTAVAGLVELATDAETQTGTDIVRAVTPSGLQSKVSDSISTTSSTTIASATAVKTAYDLANAALPKSGGRVTGELEIGPAGSLVFEGSTDDGFETTIAVVNPTADRTVTFPNVTGTVVTTGDTGSVTSTMILDGTIVNADVNASAAIDLSKLATGALPSGITVNSANIVDGTIVNADVNASAAIAGTKVAPDFGSQTITTTGVISPALGTAALPSVAFTGDPNTGIYSPGADQVAISTNAVERVEFGTSEVVFNDGGENYDFRIEGDTNANLFFVDASTDRVGLGTSAPRSRLEVVGETTLTNSLADNTNKLGRLLGAPFVNSDTQYLAIDIQGLSGENRILYGGGSALLNAATSHRFFTAANATTLMGTERVRIDDQGRVGIGTTIPGSLISVEGSSASGTAASIGLINTESAASLTFVAAGTAFSQAGWPTVTDAAIIRSSFSTTNGIAIQTGVDAPIAFWGASSERARIDSSGRLLVGTSTNSEISTLVLQGNSTAITGAPFLLLQRGVSVPGTNDALGVFSFGNNASNSGAQIVANRDGGTWTSGSSHPGRLVFSTTADGASSPTEVMRLTSSNYLRMASGTGGIQFGGDTAAANALDDYEEGTWTVQLFDAASGGNLSATTTTGNYTKIGRSVSIAFSFSNISTAGMTAGNILYFTLPFTSAGTARGTALADTIAFGTGRTYVISAANTSGTRGFLSAAGTATTDNSLTVAALTSGISDVVVAITYNA